LRDKGYVSEERVERAESDAKARQAGCDSARAQVREAEARIGASRADMARTVEVEVAFDDPGGARHLLVGYSADVEIILARRDNVLRIPTAALLPGSRVLLLGADGALAERRVETGLANWEYSEIRSGLARGDRVVTSLERSGVKAGVRAAAEAGTAAAAGK